MSQLSAVVLLLVVTACSTHGFTQLISHSDSQTGTPTGHAVIVSLFNPTYPPLASQANITGDVELKLGIRKDRSVESAVVMTGHPMLAKAALDSARQSRFECPGCTEQVTSYSLTYSFQLVAGPEFPCSQIHQHVTQSENHVTVTGEPHLVHPYFSSIRVRSAKCLYLWNCGSQWSGEHYYYYPTRAVKCLYLWNCGHSLREPFARCERLHHEIW